MIFMVCLKWKFLLYLYKYTDYNNSVNNKLFNCNWVWPVKNQCNFIFSKFFSHLFGLSLCLPHYKDFTFSRNLKDISIQISNFNSIVLIFFQNQRSSVLIILWCTLNCSEKSLFITLEYFFSEDFNQPIKYKTLSLIKANGKVLECLRLCRSCWSFIAPSDV